MLETTHVFEEGRIRVWKLYCNTCPAGDHPLGDLVVDEELKADINDYREGRRLDEEATNAKEKDERLSRLIQFVRYTSLECRLKALKRSSLSLDDLGSSVQVGIGVSYVDFVGNQSITALAGSLKSSYMEPPPVTTLAIKEMFTANPDAHFVTSLSLAGYHYLKGNYRKGSLNVASGIAGRIPNVGWLLALFIDLYLFKDSICKVYQSKKEVSFEITKKIKENPHQFLGLKNDTPTEQEVVDYAYQESVNDIRNASQRVFDNAFVLEKDIERMKLQLEQFFNQSRLAIYKQRGWREINNAPQ